MHAIAISIADDDHSKGSRYFGDEQDVVELRRYAAAVATAEIISVDNASSPSDGSSIGFDGHECIAFVPHGGDTGIR